MDKRPFGARDPRTRSTHRGRCVGRRTPMGSGASLFVGLRKKDFRAQRARNNLAGGLNPPAKSKILWASSRGTWKFPPGTRRASGADPGSMRTYGIKFRIKSQRGRRCGYQRHPTRTDLAGGGTGRIALWPLPTPPFHNPTAASATITLLRLHFSYYISFPFFQHLTRATLDEPCVLKEKTQKKKINSKM